MGGLLAKRDFYAGCFAVLVGAVAIEKGLAVDFGSITEMGPGFMPVILGVVMILLGVAVALGATGPAAEPGAEPAPRRLEWRAWSCILAGPLLFIVLGQVFGYLPAAFACVFVAAMGDRDGTVVASALLAAGVTVVGGLIFLVLLNVPLPWFQWGPG